MLEHLKPKAKSHFLWTEFYFRTYVPTSKFGFNFQDQRGAWTTLRTNDGTDKEGSEEEEDAEMKEWMKEGTVARESSGEIYFFAQQPILTDAVELDCHFVTTEESHQI